MNKSIGCGKDIPTGLPPRIWDCSRPCGSDPSQLCDDCLKRGDLGGEREGKCCSGAINSLCSACVQEKAHKMLLTWSKEDLIADILNLTSKEGLREFVKNG